MPWYWDIYQAVKKTRKSDYHYNIIENTPILHSSDILKTMYDNADHDQKASIYKHIIDHDVQDLDGYKDIATSIWDDYS